MDSVNLDPLFSLSLRFKQKQEKKVLRLKIPLERAVLASLNVGSFINLYE